MAVYATVEQVLERYEGSPDTAFVQVHLDDAEADLLDLVPGLAARAAASTTYAARVRRVLVRTVIDYLRNPEGFTYEVGGDRAVNRSTTDSRATAGRITFAPADLLALRAPEEDTVGSRTVGTPLAAERAAARRPAPYGLTGRDGRR